MTAYRVNCNGLLGGSIVIDVLESQHFCQLLLLTSRKTTPLCEAIGVLKRTEQAIPPGNVAKVVFVHIQLMMDRVVFRALNEPPYELRRTDVGVIEVLACGAEERRPCAGFGRTAENAVDEETRDD